MLSRILVPVNFSTASARALAVARDFRTESSVIRLLCVIHPKDFVEASASYTVEPARVRAKRNKAEAEARERLLAWAREDEEVAVEVGNVAEKISEHADAWDASLICMGTRVRGGIKHFLQGSATEWLVRYARQPVLAIHDVELKPHQAKHLPPLDQ